MSIGLTVLAFHLFGDFILQTNEMARYKFDSHIYRAYHVLVYTLPFFLVVLLYSLPLSFLLLVAVPHFVIDTRRWAKPKDGFESFPIWVDQTLHIMSLAIAVLVVTWTPVA